jgi:hypothetical protein
MYAVWMEILSMEMEKALLLKALTVGQNYTNSCGVNLLLTLTLKDFNHCINN